MKTKQTQKTVEQKEAETEGFLEALKVVQESGFTVLPKDVIKELKKINGKMFIWQIREFFNQLGMKVSTETIRKHRGKRTPGVKFDFVNGTVSAV